MPLVKPALPPRPSSTATASSQQEVRLPVFAHCTRTTFTADHDDWYHITSPKAFPDVDICSTCYNATFRDTPYARCLSKAGPKPKGTGTKCDLSDRWNRTATLWLFSQNHPDLDLLGRVALHPPDEDGPCPNLNTEDQVVQKGGKPAVTRTWYCIYDTATASHIEDLTVCSACVFRINAIFPSLRGLFRPILGGEKVQATCDFITAQNDNDGRRGELYLDKLIEAEQATLQTGRPDTRPLVAHFRKWAPIPVCLKADPVPAGVAYYTFPTSMPSYAACQECYTVHVLPLLSSPNPPLILKELNLHTSPQGFVCDLYSPRLQGWFAEAAQSYNMEVYREKLMGREAKAREVNVRLGQLKVQYQQAQSQARLYDMQMHAAQSAERVRAMGWNSSAYYAPPLDFSRSTAAMNQSHQALLKAEMLEQDYEMVRKEWRELYE